MKANLWRTVENQARWELQNAVEGDFIDIGILEEFVAETKPKHDLEKEFQKKGYHVLIYTQFLYDTPVPPDKAARFRPRYSSKNVFYGGLEVETSLTEAAYYFMRERVHLAQASASANPKTVFEVSYADPQVLDITKHPGLGKIMARNDFSASHEFIRANPCHSLLYPSARRDSGYCAAIFDIVLLGKKPLSQGPARFTYDRDRKACRIDSDFGLHSVDWTTVS